MSHLSCLQVERHARSHERLSYQFLHLTFQEFFAAKCLVEHCRENKPIRMNKDTSFMPVAFIHQYQYNPRYEIVWWFVAGLLSEESLAEFFNTLASGPQDLMGIQHQHLIMHCLKESHERLPSDQQILLEASVYGWLRIELKRLTGAYAISALGRQAAFPERWLLELLEEETLSTQEQCVIIRTLGERTMLSEMAIDSLITLLRDADSNVGWSAARAFGGQTALPEAAIDSLALLRDEDKEVKAAAAEAFKGQTALPEQAIDSLITLLRDENSYVRESATSILMQTRLSKQTIAKLLVLYRDHNIVQDVSSVLKNQPPSQAYSLIAQHFDWIEPLYALWLMPANLQQVNPFYLHNNQLYFYSDTKLEIVSLDRPNEFKDAILKAQQAMSIPKNSQIKIGKSVFFQKHSSYDTFFSPPIPGAWPEASNHEYRHHP